MSFENYTSSAIYRRLGLFKTLLLLVALLAIGFYAGTQWQRVTTIQDKQRIEALSSNLDSLYQENSLLQQKYNILNVELQVEKLASKEAQVYLQDAQDEGYALKRQLQFYQKVMAPELEAGGLVIEDFKLSPTTSLNYFRFKLTLVQTRAQKRATRGRVSITIQGSENQQPKELDLVALAAMPNNQFSFKYFDILEGDFQLPENFVPEQVTIDVQLPKTKWQKAASVEHIMSWSDTGLL